MVALLAPAPAGTAQILLGGRINLSGLELSIHIWPNARGCLKLDGNLRINGQITGSDGVISDTSWLL